MSYQPKCGKHDQVGRDLAESTAEQSPITVVVAVLIVVAVLSLVFA